VIGVSAIGISGFLFLYAAVADHSIGEAIPGLLIAAFSLVAWRFPGVGALLILFSPIGAFLVVLGSTNLDPASQVILGLIVWAGLPFVSGALLVAAEVVSGREERATTRSDPGAARKNAQGGHGRPRLS
jgi:hypothetical protein